MFLVCVGRTRKLDLTHVHFLSLERVRSSWKEDAFFGYQFLNGANPMVLKRSASLPSRLVFPPGMEKLQAQLSEELEVRTSKHQEGQAGKWRWAPGMGVLAQIYWEFYFLLVVKRGSCRTNPRLMWRNVVPWLSHYRRGVYVEESSWGWPVETRCRP